MLQSHCGWWLQLWNQKTLALWKESYDKPSESESHSIVPTLCDPMDYIVCGILQDRILEWVAFPFSSGLSQPRNQTGISCTADRFFTNWANDKPRQHIKKQRHHLADKGLYSQSGGFSSSHVWIWDLDHEEGWVLKNWCFHIVVLDKTLESPLNCKEIKPVNPKGNQPWCWSSNTLATWCEELTHWKKPWCWERQKEKGAAKDEMVRWHHWLSRHESEQTVGDSGGYRSLVCCSPRGGKESDTTRWLNNSNSSARAPQFLDIPLKVVLASVYPLPIYFSVASSKYLSEQQVLAGCKYTNWTSWEAFCEGVEGGLGTHVGWYTIKVSCIWEQLSIPGRTF